jgi:short-subunit dehydrogenase
MNLKGKNILISGASSGMGKEIAYQLSKFECNLAIFARRDDELKKISEKITKENNKTKCIFKKCDVKNLEDIRNAVDFTYKNYGKIDIAILSAGILIPNPIQTFDSKIIKNSIDINFMGSVYFTEFLMKIMKSQKSGTIVVTSTLPDRRGVPGWGAYGASKAAVSWFFESLRSEARKRYNINIITLKPGSVKTPMIDKYHRRGAISVEKASEIIINGIIKDKKVIQFPLGQLLMTRAMDMFPVFVYDKLDVDLQKGDGYPEVKEY